LETRKWMEGKGGTEWIIVWACGVPSQF